MEPHLRTSGYRAAHKGLGAQRGCFVQDHDQVNSEISKSIPHLQSRPEVTGGHSSAWRNGSNLSWKMFVWCNLNLYRQFGNIVITNNKKRKSWTYDGFKRSISRAENVVLSATPRAEWREVGTTFPMSQRVRSSFAFCLLFGSCSGAKVLTAASRSEWQSLRMCGCSNELQAFFGFPVWRDENGEKVTDRQKICRHC